MDELNDNVSVLPVNDDMDQEGCGHGDVVGLPMVQLSK